MENVNQITPLNAAVFAAVGLVLALAGYRLMRLYVKAMSALLFGAVGMSLGTETGIPLLALGIGIAASIAGYLLGDALYYVNMFLNGAIVGGFLAGLGTLALLQEPVVIVIASAVGILAGGILAVVFQRPIGIFATALIGSGCLAAGALGAARALVPSAADGREWAFGLFLAAMTLVSCVIQGATTRTLPNKGEEAVKEVPAARP